MIVMDDVLEHTTSGSSNSVRGRLAAYTGKGIPEKRGFRRLTRKSERLAKLAANPGMRRLEHEFRKLLYSYIRVVPLLLKDLEFQLLAAADGSPQAKNDGETAWIENPFAPYALTAHGIKFASEEILAAKTGKRAEKLENAALRGDLDYLKEKTPEFLDYMECFIDKLKHLLGEGWPK